MRWMEGNRWQKKKNGQSSEAESTTQKDMDGRSKRENGVEKKNVSIGEYGNQKYWALGYINCTKNENIYILFIL